MPIQLVVFDMAGTTVEDDSNVTKALYKAFEESGFSILLPDIDKVMGYPKPSAIRKLLEQYTIPFNNKLIEKIHERFVSIMKMFYKTDPDIREKDGVSETFALLKEQGIKVAIDTGFSRDIADIILQRLGWQDQNLIDTSVTSDEVANGRPFPDMIFKAMEQLQITDIAKVAKVGDTASDVQQGNAAGCKYVIAISTGSYSAEDLLTEHPTHLVSHITEVAGIVLEQTVMEK